MFASTSRAQPAPGPPTALDGPSAAITSLNGVSVARDGTGGLVYLKTVGGVAHVFVSSLLGGQFQTPVQVDAGLAGASSQPVIAAGNAGVLLVAFINAGQLYVVGRTAAAAPYSSPSALAGGALNPSLEMTNFGKAYLAFAVADGSGHDVRAAYYYNGSWAVEPAPLNVTPADDAGTKAGAAGGPQVAASGDGVAIVVWGEGGHVYSRRVWGTSPSVVNEQADAPSLSGCGEVSAGQPAVATGGDSSYADVAFQETVSCGGVRQTRVLVNRLRASRYDGVTSADALSTPGAANATDPQVAMTEYGTGFVTAVQQTTNAVIVMQLGDSGAYGGLVQINSLPPVSTPHAIPAVAGVFSDLIAWQQDPGATGPADIRVRYEPRAGSLGPELVVSSPGRGPADAGRGLAADGDGSGDAAIAWVQGTGASTQIVVDQLYQPPGSPAARSRIVYSRTAQPQLSWSPADKGWGPITYTVTLDGAQVGQTGAGSIGVPSPLRDGSHNWQVTATNPAGLTGTSKAARVFVDTIAPLLTVTVPRSLASGSPEAIRVRYRDAPPLGLPPSDASGVAAVTIRWGDGTVTHVKPGTHRIVHDYRRPGRYRLTVTATDHAGNQTAVVRHLKVKKAGPAKGGKR